MSRHTDTDETPHVKRMPMLKRIAMPGGPIPPTLSRKENSDQAMDVFHETVPGAGPSTTERRVAPHGRQTISRAFETREGEDSMQSAPAYRNFLHDTQDVFAASEHYPGGMTGLIRHREEVAIRLVRLLGVSAAASSL